MSEIRSHLAHPWAVGVIVYWLILALALVIGPPVGWHPVLSLVGVDMWLSIAIGTGLGVGSGMVLASLHQYPYRSTRWRLEIVGLILTGGAWSAYGWMATTTFPYGMSGWGQAAAFVVACVLRIVEVVRMERKTRQVVADLRSVA